jgi:glutamate synthase domain-containing protein 1
MCGVSGIFHKKATPGRPAPIGRDLVRMLDSLAHRGRDSTGFTVAGESMEADLIVRLRADGASPEETAARVKDAVSRLGAVVVSLDAQGDFIRLFLNYEGEVPELAGVLLNMPEIEIHSIGESSEVVKDVGTASDVDSRHGLASLRGTHGIGHVRLATESIVDINHAHPFWAYPFPDVTVVHNGQLTNYHKMKRKYEDAGHRFQTHNDSELIAVYLADKMANGETLEDSLRASLEDLDGTFTYLVSTKDCMGCAKDRWSAKPLVAMETDDVVAVASEEVALRSVFHEEIARTEPQEAEVMTWSS